MAQQGVMAVCVCGRSLEADRPGEDGTVPCGGCGRRVVVDASAAARAQGAPSSVLTQSVAPLETTGPKPFAALDVPEKLGPYRVLGRLGEGGMGVVFKGHDDALDRPVALKVLQRTRGAEAELALLEREARSIAAITHPNVVQVYSAGEKNGLAFFAMELVLGPDLREVLEREGPLDVARARRYMTHAVLGLKAAAKKGIFHRDVKPANLLLDTREDVVKVADFGLAKRAAVDASLGGTSLIAGTPLYVAPEVIENGEGDERADMYSLAATFFHLLTGEPPFGGKIAAEALVGHARKPAPDVRTLRPDVPADLAGLLLRSLEKDPAKRFASYDELLLTLEPARPISERVVTKLPIPPAPPVAPVIPVAVPVARPLPEREAPRVVARVKPAPPRSFRGRRVFLLALVVGAFGVTRVAPQIRWWRHTPRVRPTPQRVRESHPACDFASLVDALRAARALPADVLSPLTVSEARDVSRREGLNFETSLDDECPSGLGYAVAGTSSPVIVWHVHDTRARTVEYATPDGRIKTAGLLEFLFYLRATNQRRGGSWSEVVDNIRPFLPRDVHRELEIIDAENQ